MRPLPPSTSKEDQANSNIGQNPLAEHFKTIEKSTLALQKDPDSVSDYEKRASAFFALADFGRALADLNRAIALAPDRFDLYFHRGNTYKAMGDLTRARGEYDRAIALQPSEPGLYYHRALLLAPTDPDSALRDLDHAIELHPGALPAYLERGKLHRDQEKPSEAIQDFAVAYEISRHDVTIRPYLEEMRLDCNARVVTHPQDSRAYQDRFHLNVLLGDNDAALADVTYQIKLEPHSVVPVVNRGALRYKMGDYAGVVADMEVAIAREPRNGPLYRNKAIALLRLQRVPEALSTLAVGIAKAPNHAELFCLRGSLLRQMGRFVPALIDINEAIRLEPHNPFAYDERYGLHAARTDWYRAATDAMEAVRLAPNAERNYRAGFALCNQNRWAEALPYLDAALAADPDHADARIERQRIQHRLHKGVFPKP